MMIDHFFQSMNAAFPIAPAVGVALNLMQKGSDAVVNRTNEKTSTIQSTSKLYFFKTLYMAATPTRLAVFQVKPGLLQNTLGELLAAMPLQDLRDLQITGGIGVFRRLTITSVSGATLTFQVEARLLKEANQLRDVVASHATVTRFPASTELEPVDDLIESAKTLSNGAEHKQ